AMDIKADDSLARLAAFGEKPAERAGLQCQASLVDVPDQAVQSFCHRFLCRIARQGAGLDQMTVALRDGRVRYKAVAQGHVQVSGRKAVGKGFNDGVDGPAARLA